MQTEFLFDSRSGYGNPFGIEATRFNWDVASSGAGLFESCSKSFSNFRKGISFSVPIEFRFSHNCSLTTPVGMHVNFDGISPFRLNAVSIPIEPVYKPIHAESVVAFEREF